jgi:hypothetical protein
MNWLLQPTCSHSVISCTCSFWSLTYRCRDVTYIHMCPFSFIHLDHCRMIRACLSVSTAHMCMCWSTMFSWIIRSSIGAVFSTQLIGDDSTLFGQRWETCGDGSRWYFRGGSFSCICRLLVFSTRHMVIVNHCWVFWSDFNAMLH